MAEPSPNPAIIAPSDIDPALTNGLAQQAPIYQPADVEMADSGAVQAPPPLDDAHPQTDSTPTHQPTVQTVPPTPTASTPAPPSAPTLPTTATTTTTTPAASSRNSPHPTTAQAPTQPIPHGSPTRVYLNQHVTPHLLEAMKHLATAEPEKPLKWLSEFLAGKSREVEGL